MLVAWWLAGCGLARNKGATTRAAPHTHKPLPAATAVASGVHLHPGLALLPHSCQRQMGRVVG